MQVNYRSSTGYGKKYLNAGNKEWGRKMHNDLVDAVNWAIDQGIAAIEARPVETGTWGGVKALYR
mgnify:CR=1 FL=1